MPPYCRPRRTLLSLLAVLGLTVTVAACGSSDSNSSTSSAGASTAAATDTGTMAGTTAADDATAQVSEAEVQETINKAMGAEVPIASLDKPIVDAFTRAAAPLPQEKLDKALECWKASKCEVGDGDVTLAIVDGNDNTWRKFTKMETILQALTYPEIGKIIYTQANGDLAQMQANIRSVTAQGAKAIVTYDDFGAAVGPAYAAAQRGGAVVSNYLGPVDAPEDTIAVQAIADNCKIGQDMADAGAATIDGKGPVAFFNGTPGNPQGQTWNKCATDQFAAKFPEVKVVAKADTSWSSAGAIKAASGLISGGKDVSAIFYDFADPLVDVVNTYEKAGKKTPNLITWTENNGLYGVWEKAQGTPGEFTLVTTSALGWTSRISVTAVMEKLGGGEVANKVIFPVPFFEATKGMYQANRPKDFPGVSSLVPESLIDRMLQ